jgi:hypothetical protein
MTELAFTEDGEHFQVPATVARWRVRRFANPGARGGAQLVYGHDGTPLFLDVDSDPEEFREAVGGVPGRYRLDGVDQQARVVDKVPAAYLMISGPAMAGASGGYGPPPMTSSLEFAVVEMAKANCEAIRAITDKLGGVVDAVGGVLRAADAAGLPRRLPLGPLLLDNAESDDDDDEENDEGAARPSSQTKVSTMLGQVMQMVTMFASMRGADSPKLGAVMGQVIETAKVVEATGTTASASAAPPVADDNDDDSNDDDQGAAVRPNGANGANGAKPRASSSGKDRSSPTSSATTVDPMAHFHLILTELTPDEQGQVQHMVTTLSVRDLMQWYEQLANMPVADAAAMIRGELARVGKEHKS